VVAKLNSTTNEDNKVFGVSGAARFLNCSEGTVLNYANKQRLPHFKDSSNRRLFRFRDLQKFKRANVLGRNRQVQPS
jgi:hypothetical protein